MFELLSKTEQHRLENFPANVLWLNRVPKDFTQMGGDSGQLPTTQWGLISACQKRDPGWEKLFNQFVAAYWKPVYAYVRTRWGKSNEEAKDLVQDFFLSLLEHESLAGASASHGSFRTLLKVMLRNFVINRAKFDQRQKRGGTAVQWPIESVDVPGDDPESSFDRAWIRSVLDRAVALLEETCRLTGKESAFQAFREYYLKDRELSYTDLATELRETTPVLKKQLEYCRGQLRRNIIQIVASTAGSREELQEELRALFGITDPSV
jgi:RNA polymerase sigma factor (sigma-70 family)